MLNIKQIATKFNATEKRIFSIYQHLFGDAEVPQEVAEKHIGEVLAIIKKGKETVAVACSRYTEQVKAEHQQHKAQADNRQPQKAGTGSVQDILKRDKEAAEKLALQRYASFVQHSDEVLTHLLSEGIDGVGLANEFTTAMSDKSDALYDAILGRVSATGSYLIAEEDNAPKLGPVGGIIAWLPPSLSAESSQPKQPANNINGNGN